MVLIADVFIGSSYRANNLSQKMKTLLKKGSRRSSTKWTKIMMTNSLWKVNHPLWIEIVHTILMIILCFLTVLQSSKKEARWVKFENM